MLHKNQLQFGASHLDFSQTGLLAASMANIVNVGIACSGCNASMRDLHAFSCQLWLMWSDLQLHKHFINLN